MLTEEKLDNRLEQFLHTSLIQGVPGGKDLTLGVFLRSNYTDITQNTYTQSSMVTEILAREV